MTYPQQIPPPGAYGIPGPVAPSASGQVWKRVAVGVSVVAALVVGLFTGALLIRPGSEPTAPAFTETATAPITETPDAQDIKLCTAFAIINSAMPKRDDSPRDYVPTVAALQAALATYPQATVRAPINEFLDTLYARIGSYAPVRARGLSEPPVYSADALKSAYDRAWSACRLDEE